MTAAEKQKKKILDGIRELVDLLQGANLPDEMPEVEELPGVMMDGFFEAWNALPDGIPKIQEISKARRAKYRCRMQNKWWQINHIVAMAQIPGLAGLCGENDRNWKIDVDFFLRPNTVARILEGKYDLWGKAKDEMAAASKSNKINFMAGLEDE